MISQNAPLIKKNTTPYHPKFFIQLASSSGFSAVSVLNVRMVALLWSRGKRRRCLVLSCRGLCALRLHVANVLAACDFFVRFPLKKRGIRLGTRFDSRYTFLHGKPPNPSLPIEWLSEYRWLLSPQRPDGQSSLLGWPRMPRANRHREDAVPVDTGQGG